MNVEKSEVIRIERQPSLLLIMTDQNLARKCGMFSTTGVLISP